MDKVGEIRLLSEDRKLLENGCWLNDKHINAAQALLRAQHPHVSSMQNTLLQQNDGFDVQRNKVFVQCLILRNNHWITVSNIGCPPDTIKVFDSLNLSLSSSIKRTIASLVHTNNSSYFLEYADMQYQSGGNDCGLFALATACALCHGQDPSKLEFEQKSMRSHLLSAFDKKNLSPFPSRPKVKRARISRKESVKVYCVCRLTDDGSRMVQCTSCQEWYHVSCINVHPRLLGGKKPWHCSICQA